MLSIKRLNLELEDIQEELMGLPLIRADCRIADFGCERGYTTLALMLALHAIDCIGVDKNRTWQLPTLDEAQQYFKNIKEGHQTNGSPEKVKQLLDEKRWPRFQQQDVLDAQNLPDNLDLAYCKLLLGNIFGGDYGNSRKSYDGVNKAIQNIAGCIKQDGLFCFAEKPIADINFRLLIPNEILKFLRVCCIERGTIGDEGRRSPAESILVHIYRKR